MGTYKKQHIISKTYLKRFSDTYDGKNLFVIDSSNQHVKHIQKKNSGDSIFWIENYSDSNDFSDNKAIEKMFGQYIEPNYNRIVNEIYNENEKLSIEDKNLIIQWIFYTKMRSPIWENKDEYGKPIYKNKIHLNNFLDDKLFSPALLMFINDTINKQWTIYRCTPNETWWTTDNPGYCIDLNLAESHNYVIPDPFCRLTGVDTILFYPLSKDYCLNIHAYEKGTPPEYNLTNTPIKFKESQDDWVKIINTWTLMSQSRLLISNSKTSLERTLTNN